MNSNARTLNRSKQTNKPYCKVCHDAGKSETEYRSHYVRSQPDATGKTNITCPTLLNTECRYCYELGHTIKFCPSLIAKEKADDRSRKQEDYRAKKEIQQAQQKETEKKQNRYSSNGFAALKEETEQETCVVIEDFPALGQPSKRVQICGYADAVAKMPTVMITTKKIETPCNFTVLKQGAKYEKTIVEKPKYLPGSWASYDTDSEDEEE
jgi:hypothetical protein